MQGCKVGIAPAGRDSNVQHIFIVTLPEELAGLGILKRTNYVLAARDYEDMQSWIGNFQAFHLYKMFCIFFSLVHFGMIKLQAQFLNLFLPGSDAIKLASLSKRKLQAKVDHAYMEVQRIRV